MSWLKNFLYIISGLALFMPVDAFATGWEFIDGFNLAPFVPLVLDAMMAIATGGYEFFVGGGDGIIYVLVWGFLTVSLAMYAVKMFFPKIWVSFLGFSGGGEMTGGGTDAMTISQNVLKPIIRAIIAVTILLQLRPVYLTQWLVNPFLQLGAIYTQAITDTITQSGVVAPTIECPPDILSHDWISADSCKFLVQPVSDLSAANNQIIKRGFDFFNRGLRGLITLVPHGGEDFLNLITGIILITTFVASNLFMALLVIQAIFNFGMSLILYPFHVLTYVVKPSDKWMDIWPAFSGITSALQKLIITMIACAFILCINLAIVKSLFQWHTSVFVVAANGAATSNVPTVSNSALGFGEHSILWLSAVLTFYVMFKIFNITRAQIMAYAGGGADALYNQVTSDTRRVVDNTISWGNSLRKAIGWARKK